MRRTILIAKAGFRNLLKPRWRGICRTASAESFCGTTPSRITPAIPESNAGFTAKSGRRPENHERKAIKKSRESWEGSMKRLCVYLLAVGLGGSAASAQAPVSFQGKTVTAIISSSAGGGTDAYGRLAAAFFEKYLPGSPTVVPRNVPGADGMSAMNFMVQQVAPDGYTFAAASNS